jgi:multidrug efflux pump subunit AcrA (membrane-fusion protein)
MSFWKKVKKKVKKGVKATVDVATLGQADKLEELGEGIIDVQTTITTGGLDKAKDKQDEAKAAEAAAKAEAEAEKATIQEKQNQLRKLELEKAVGEQTEAEQLAQRALFRQSNQLASEAQQRAASAKNIAAQLGTSNSSVSQGTISSINTSQNVLQGDIISDQNRLAANLDKNLEFLGQTFALGGDINAASQRLASQQAAIEERAKQRANFIGGAGTGASLAALAGGGPMAVVGAAVLGGVVGGDVDLGQELENFFSF